jgi:hypothetical protein
MDPDTPPTLRPRRSDDVEVEPVDAADGQQKTWVKVLAAVLVVAAIAVAATTGDSIAVRMILLVVSFDVAVRLWRW